MNVTPAHRTRHLVIRVDRGEELPGALIRALDEAEARAAFITGVGAVEAAEIVLFDGGTRRIDTPCAVASLIGDAALSSGVLSLRLSATLARETELGPQIIAGQLRWARAASLDLHVTVLDDVGLHRAQDERPGSGALIARSAGASPLAEPARAAPVRAEPARPEPARPEPARPEPAPEAAAPGATAMLAPSPALPQRPMRHADDVEAYPEVGDAVTHFHFGECTVISSDGDRIRLRQDRDGRVREVALAMLKIEAPTEVDGKRHFKLQRKH